MSDDYDYVLSKIKKSSFRSKFFLSKKDKEYVLQKGIDTIKKHTEDFIINRLAEENPKNDGKQTPMKGHPTFIAQHATATCCRGCLYKWHHIEIGKRLTQEEIQYIVNIIMLWINEQMEKENL